MERNPLWQPTEKFLVNTHLHNYKQWLADTYGVFFETSEALWEWSVLDISLFWKSIWEYFGIIDHGNFSEVISTDSMPNTRWFTGSKINYAEHIFRKASHNRPAILFKNETNSLHTVSWETLRKDTASFARFLQDQGVKHGDRVVGYLPNVPETIVAFLATNSIGAVWSLCSPDFGTQSVIERFQQIEPKVLIGVGGYRYNGKYFDREKETREITSQLPSLSSVVYLPYENTSLNLENDNEVLWADVLKKNYSEELLFTPVSFSHPIWVLYSSGTTGKPKAITHSCGGMLLEHLKYVHFHNDVHTGQAYFWFTTTGWMMWNFLQSTLLAGATVVLYDGSPGFPNMGSLWRLVEQCNIVHFGTSAPYIAACMKRKIVPKEYNLSSLRSISSTGSPLSSESFAYVYEKIKKDLWLVSMSGGTDVCTAFVGGSPEKPVYEGEIQCRALGCSLYALDENGNSIVGDVGEMVITKPMPSMPIYFWNDPLYERYTDSYFTQYPGMWRHGDWITINTHGGLVIHGRSDATLNRHGIRIGTAEIYRTISKLPEIEDSLIVNIEKENGSHFMPLFVKLNPIYSLTEELIVNIGKALKNDYSPRYIPDEVVLIKDIPYTISGKKMETPVKKLLMGMPVEKCYTPDAMRNPECMKFFIDYTV